MVSYNTYVDIDVDEFVEKFELHVVKALKELGYLVYPSIEDLIEDFRLEGYFMNKSDTLVENCKREWFEKAIDKYSLEEFESKLPI